ncbi:MAG TPA: HAD-IA family hydrolase, partial [Acidimicrobiia bacterium]|nr:HAD-IA family hydrolase [Acidimicrobiia bacterium]
MNGVDAVAFDLYGTLAEVASVGRAAAEVTEDPAALVDMWRQKQLEYTWLRSLMGRYQDFWTTTGDALEYSLDRLGITVDGPTRAGLLDAWLAVRVYPEVPDALASLAPRQLAVLSNGNS